MPRILFYLKLYIYNHSNDAWHDDFIQALIRLDDPQGHLIAVTKLLIWIISVLLRYLSYGTYQCCQIWVLVEY